MTPLERTLLSQRTAYGIELLCVHASWVHDNLYGENHQLAVEAHGRAKAVWGVIDQAMAALDADLRSADAIGASAAEFRSDRERRPHGISSGVRTKAQQRETSPSKDVRQGGAPPTVSRQLDAKLQGAS